MQTQVSTHSVNVHRSIIDGKWNSTRDGFEFDMYVTVLGPDRRVVWEAEYEDIPADSDPITEAMRVAAERSNVAVADVPVEWGYTINGPEWELRHITDIEFSYLTCGLADLYAETLALMRSRYEVGLAERRALIGS